MNANDDPTTRKFLASIPDAEEYANTKLFKNQSNESERKLKQNAFHTIISMLSSDQNNIYLINKYGCNDPNWNVYRCYTHLTCVVWLPLYISWIEEFAKLFMQKGYIVTTDIDIEDIKAVVRIYTDPEQILQAVHQRRMREQVLPALIQAAWHPRRVAFILSEAGMSD